ncbi:MAG: vWA domain-containing protein [Promethearchaeota archaeon]
MLPIQGKKIVILMAPPSSKHDSFKIKRSGASLDNDEIKNNLRLERLKKIAKEAWDEAVYDMCYPDVPEPKITFSEEYKEPFYIDMDTLIVYLNLFHVPYKDDDSFRKFVRSVSHHELGHYTIAPYDGVTSALMFQGAMTVLEQEHAPIVCNVVSDLIIEHELALRFKELTKMRTNLSLEMVVNQFHENKVSRFWKIIVEAESIITGNPLPDFITKKIDFNDVEKDAKTIAKIVKKQVENINEWPKVTKKVASVLKKYLENDAPISQAQKPSTSPSSGARAPPGGGGNVVIIPDEVLGHSGDVTKISDRDNGRLNEKILKKKKENARGKKGTRGDFKDLDDLDQDTLDDDLKKQILKKLAKHAKNLHEFGGPATALGLVLKGDVLASWYRYRGENLLNFDIKVEKPSGQVPITPTKWRIGDPIESLDLTLTLMNSPLIIPNLTTRKWEFRMGTGIQQVENYPDLLIVLDSSNSMGWNPSSSKHNRGLFDTALVASFAALHFANRKDIKFAAINFSGYVFETEWTKNVSEIEQVLLYYQNDGTVLPTENIMNLVKKNNSPTIILIISDAGLYNWQKSVPPLMKLIKDGHFILFFIIGANASILEKKRFRDFVSLGGKIYVISRVQDLAGLVVEEIQKIYSPKSVPGEREDDGEIPFGY